MWFEGSVSWARNASSVKPPKIRSRLILIFIGPCDSLLALWLIRSGGLADLVSVSVLAFMRITRVKDRCVDRHPARILPIEALDEGVVR